jgi:putative oxygen-independent coproporphyrinogen III oxidase
MPLHLYVHLPYCRRKCPYCDFFKKVPHAGERERFIQALLNELDIASQEYSFYTKPAKTVYFGGGTPSLHPPVEIAALISKVTDIWGIEEKAEITLEANPGMLNRENLKGWRKAGVNRLSIGAQSFSERKLKLLYRDHTVAQIHDGVTLAREAGYGNISLDLIFGLPDETADEWKSDLETAAALAPEHVSLYNLEYHEGTPFQRWRDEGRLRPLTEDVEADLYLLTHAFFTTRGYEHYEVSNFAKPGYRAIHNSAYWEGKPYLGLGPSAHSFDGKALRFFNKPDLHEYFAAIEQERLPVGDKEMLSAHGRAEEWIALALRRSDGIRFTDAVRELGQETAHALWRRARDLPANARRMDDTRISLTAEGWFRENSVLLYLFEDLNMNRLPQ